MDKYYIKLHCIIFKKLFPTFNAGKMEMRLKIKSSLNRGDAFLLTVSVLAVRRFHLNRMPHLKENRENDFITYARIHTDLLGSRGV